MVIRRSDGVRRWFGGEQGVRWWFDGLTALDGGLVEHRASGGGPTELRRWSGETPAVVEEARKQERSPISLFFSFSSGIYGMAWPVNRWRIKGSLERTPATLLMDQAALERQIPGL
ncbi:hypothetical protein KFK09_014807 [Dendrobium nobile]|uniref:Uncharacterized protein n=1 Tax=Dendrobium nobile TaxID=94219 RepID=A0A8T3B333_DENNO|nr:hypothetical protein KFK09_014807 [Dendrobium nobile]